MLISTFVFILIGKGVLSLGCKQSQIHIQASTSIILSSSSPSITYSEISSWAMMSSEIEHSKVSTLFV